MLKHAVAGVVAAILCGSALAQEPIRMVPFDQVHMEDVIWSPMTARLAEKTLPHALAQTKVAQERLRLCAEWLESNGKTPKPETHRFNTSDLYKVMEGAAMMIQAEPNPEIERQMDRIIDMITRAQQEDGYLYISHIVGNPEPGMGERPYSFLLHSHELYNVGHLYEAAVAYARATGKTKLLEVAEKNAQHVNKVFFEGDPSYNEGKPVMQAPGHQEIELGLVKLYNQTGNRLYLEMAQKFLDIRGVTFVPDGELHNSPAYAQQHKPVAEQREAVGHAVRATYQYAAMAEVDSLLGTDTYSRALDAIWHDIVDRKMHISGGLGAVQGIEGFGPAYVLPNKHTYLETCAAVGNVFFNMRMFLKYGNAKYVDVAEVALLNNSLSGVGLDGTSFFYPNLLEADFGHAPRSKWFGTACCPSNVSRLVPQVPGYMYAVAGDSLYSLLYGACTATVEMRGKRVSIRQTTRYPYDGKIGFQMDSDDPVHFRLCLRIPTWAGNQFVPGKLYHYTEPSRNWTIAINGETVKAQEETGFVVLDRMWKPNDRVTLELPMPVHANTCIPEVEANRDRVAFTRGPLLFCAEGIDNGGSVQRFFVESAKALAGSRVATLEEDSLRGLPGIELPAKALNEEEELADARIKLIPYFVWSNRDRSSMITWLGARKEIAESPKGKGKMKFAGVAASHTCEHDSVDSLRLPRTPEASTDRIQRWTSWPQKGQPQWVEIDLGKVVGVDAISVYWFRDYDGIKLPRLWHVKVPVGNEWKPLEIYNTDEYSCLSDVYNTVHPAAPLKTDRIRIAMEAQNAAAVGILSVDVEVR